MPTIWLQRYTTFLKISVLGKGKLVVSYWIMVLVLIFVFNHTRYDGVRYLICLPSGFIVLYRWQQEVDAYGRKWGM